jgi:hypothetical protein
MRRLTIIRGTSWVCLAVLVLFAVPVVVQAAGIRFRNETKVPLIVQGATLIKPGMARKGPPIFLKAGQTGWDANLPMGNRLITVYDGNQPKNILLQPPVNVAVGNKDVVISVQPIYSKAGALIGVKLVPDPNP